MPSRSLFDGSSEPEPSSPRSARTPTDAPAARTVSELVARLKDCVEPPFTNIWVAGEIVEFRGLASSGHAYFALKDAASLVRVKMWRSSISKMRFPIENGASVLAHGNVEIYGPRGELSLTIDRMIPQGVGEAAAAFEALRRKLMLEGLFAEERKRPIAYFPRAVGLVTSREGAAVRDFLKHLAERFPVRVVLAPTVVQGEAAPESIAAAIELLSEEATNLELDTLAVVRGGGGMEDLAAFNTEIVARAIVNSKIPVVTGVGHEIDTTIADLVADRRAKTPTDAANVVVPDRDALFVAIDHYWQRISEAIDRNLGDAESEILQLCAASALRGPKALLERFENQMLHFGKNISIFQKQQIDRSKSELEQLRGRLAAKSPKSLLLERQTKIERAGRELIAAAARQFVTFENSFGLAAERLEGRSPIAVLARGYSLARRAGDGAFLTKTEGLAPGDLIETRLSRGSFTSRVVDIYNKASQ